jgi:hypothetical protein
LVEDKIFNTPQPRTLVELKECVEGVIERISEDMLKRVADNVISRATACVMVDGAHLDGVIDNE